MILRWDKPKKKMSRQQWESISADSAPPGVYTPNMSDEDAATWRAKKFGGLNSRVEIRVLKGSQVLIIVRPDGSVRISMNGPAELSETDWADFKSAVQEAQAVLRES
jgi:hypothetical protein